MAQQRVIVEARQAQGFAAVEALREAVLHVLGVAADSDDHPQGDPLAGRRSRGSVARYPPSGQASPSPHPNGLRALQNGADLSDELRPSRTSFPEWQPTEGEQMSLAQLPVRAQIAVSDPHG